MAAASADMAGVCEDSSSSDDEQLKRCQEAVWDTQPFKKNDASDNGKSSKRLVIADHEHDGNELQVTQGFQTHVAKKLGLILDSLITEKLPMAVPCAENQDNKEDEDEGFRLFSTSVPGQKTKEPPTPKRRPLPSSSDSDSEMEARLKEAAVSVKDLLPESTLVQSTNSAPESPSSEITKVKKKKKKKSKLNQEDNGQVDSKSKDIQNHTVNSEEEQIHTTVKIKKKKKKKVSTENSEGEVLS